MIDVPLSPEANLHARFQRLSKFFNYSYRSKAGSNNLVVVFSHTDHVSLQNIDYNENVLFLADRRRNYFISHAPHISDALIEIANGFGGEILTMGFSKGGFGALLIAGLCARKAKARHWRALAFTPIVDLVEAGGRIPSVALAQTRAQKIPSLAARFEAFKRVAPFVKNKPNLTATICYPMKRRADASAALSLAAPNVRLFPIPIALHSILFAILYKDRPPEENRARLAEIYQRLDPDIQATATLEIDRALNDIRLMTWLPSIDELIDEALVRGRNRTPVGGLAATSAAPSGDQPRG